ncbi:restriction endonuclease subunit S [Microbacterium awajiense]
MGFVPSAEYFKKQVFSSDISTYKVVHEGQFAYATIHLDEGSIGVAPTTCVISPMYTVFSVDEARVAPDYLIRFLKSPRALASYPRLGRGTAERRKSISLDALGRLEVPLPPLPEQRRIAAILDEAEAPQENRERSARLMVELLAAEFHAIATRATTRVPLSEVAVIRAPLVDPRSPEVRDLVLYGSDAIETGSGVLTHAGSAAAQGAISGKYLVTDRAVIYSKIRPALNKVAIIEGPALTSADIYPLSPAKGRLRHEYLAFALRSPDFLRYAAALSSRAQMPKLNRESLFRYQIRLPSMGDQRFFSRAVHEAEGVRASCGAARRALDELFASLQHRAFRGEL